MAAKKSSAKRFALYWCTTADHDDDAFVVASSAREARRFHEDSEGHANGDVEVERVLTLPSALHSGAGYATDEVLVACGAEISRQRTLGAQGAVESVYRDININGRVFREGDDLDAIERELGHKHARLSMFAGGRANLPRWWDWELELSPHVEKRMEDRDFTEVDLRAMMGGATTYEADVVEGRFILKARFRNRPWEIVVEPDEEARLQVVVTAYPVDR